MNIGLFVIFLGIPLVVGLAVQWRLKRSVAENAAVPSSSGLTGAEVAETILRRNGLDDVKVGTASGGALSDHYDPRKREVFLSEAVYGERSVTAEAIAAHEVGHALQHARGYVPLRLRSAMFPVVAFASSTWMFLLIGGALLGAFGLIQLALILYAAAVAFHIVTLPVEFNASRRAGEQLGSLGLVTASEQGGVKAVLNAAALTYVAGALAALSQLIYFALIFFGDSD